MAPRSSSVLTASTLPTLDAVISGGFAGRIGLVGVGAGFEQQADHLGVAVRGRERQRRDAVAVRAGGVGAGANQPARGLDIVDANQPVERGRAVPARRVDVDLLVDQRADGGRVALHGRVGEADVLSPRDRLRGRDRGDRLRGRDGRLRHGEQRDQGGCGEPHVVPHGSTSLSPDGPQSHTPGAGSRAKNAQTPGAAGVCRPSGLPDGRT